jgi:hypothetical protein
LKRNGIEFARVEANTEAEAIKVLRREGTVEAKEISYSEGTVVFDKIVEAESPWKPVRTAPKDGRLFVAYDAVTKTAETAKWSEDEKKFVNAVGDREVTLTQWMEQLD